MNKNFGITSLLLLLLVVLLAFSQVQSCKRNKEILRLKDEKTLIKQEFDAYVVSVQSAPTTIEYIHDTVVIYKKGRISYNEVRITDTVYHDGTSFSGDFLQLKQFDGTYTTDDFEIDWVLMNELNGDLFTLDFPKYKLFTEDKVITKMVPAPSVKERAELWLGVDVGYNYLRGGVLSSFGGRVNFPMGLGLGLNIGYGYFTFGVYGKIK